MFEAKTVYGRREGIVSLSVGPQAVHISLPGRQDGIVLNLPDRSSQVWALIDGTRTWQQICSEVLRDTNTSRNSKRRADLNHLIAKLVELDMIFAMPVMKKKSATKKKSVRKSVKTVTLARAPRRSASCISRKNADGSIHIISMKDQSFFYELTGLSAVVWEKLDGKNSEDKLFQLLKRKTDLAPGELKKKLHQLLADLKKMHLLATSRD